MRVRSSARLLLVVMSMMVAPVASSAQDTNQARAYGPSAQTILRIPSWAFVPFAASDSAVTQATSNSARYCSAACTFVAPLMLPTGVVLQDLQLTGCNSHPGFVVIARVLRKPVVDGATFQLAQTQIDDFVNCGVRFASFPPDTIVDNGDNTYFIHVVLGGGDDRTRFDSVAIFYRLRVSPAPAVATFEDVPTNHPFFAFIEALVAAGITTGCGDAPPLFCPDGLVTRKQMAKFLSTALGLHWAP